MSEVAQSFLTLCDPMDCSLPCSYIHGIFQAMYWSVLLFPSPEDLPNPGIEPRSLTLQVDSLPTETPPLLIVCLERTSLVAQMVKSLPTMLETQVQCLSQEDLLEKEMATHSSILAWKIPWTEEPGRLQSMGSQRVGND